MVLHIPLANTQNGIILLRSYNKVNTKKGLYESTAVKNKIDKNFIEQTTNEQIVPLPLARIHGHKTENVAIGQHLRQLYSEEYKL